MKSKFSIAMSLAVLVAMLITSLALADVATGQSISINNGAADTNSLSVTVKASALHCPPGGDMKALEVAFSNTSSSGPWTVVHAAGTDWPGTDTDGCTSSGAGIPANFAWTLASGADGSRTVYARFKHASDEVFADDSINFTAPPADSTPPVITPNVAGILGNNGWYTSAVTVSWTVSDPDSAISSSSGCDPTIISADTAGTTLTCSATSAGGPNSQSVTIKRDATAPTANASAAPAANGNGWNNTDVTVSFTGNDVPGSGIDFCDAAVVLNSDGANQSASGTCTDKAGNVSALATASGINIDKTAPTASASASPAPNGNGWNNTDVTVSFSGNDGSGSGIASCSSAVVLGAEGAGQSASGTCTDLAGNVSDPATKSGINIDKTAPAVTATASPAPNANGWNNTNVTVSFSGTDGLSGIASCDPNVVLSGEGAGQSATGSCADKAGNSASATASNIKIDKTAPSLNITGAASGTSSVCSALPSRPTFAPSDNLSGIASQSDSWTTPSTPSGVGTYTYNATATDVAGNTTSETRTYSVNYSGAFSGYLQPINTDGSSRFKLGSTVPVKFQLTCNGVPISTAVAKLYVAKGDNQPDPGVDEAISTAASTTGNLFRYDSTSQQYIFNLSTKLGYTNPNTNTTISFSTGTWTLKIGLDDGTWQSINIQLPR